MRAIAIVLVCFACCGHGHRVQIKTGQIDGGSYAKRQNLEDDKGVRGAPLKILPAVLLASTNAAQMPSLADPQSRVPSPANQSWRHLAEPRPRHQLRDSLQMFGYDLLDHVYKDNSDIGQLAALGGRPSPLTVPKTLMTLRKVLGGVPSMTPRIKRLSSLSALTKKKDIYDLQSGEILLLSKWDTDAESLQAESDVLQAIQKAGVSVVPHKLIKTINPKTGDIVKGIIQTRIRGTFVNFQNDEESPEKLLSSLTSSPTALMNLKDDLTRIMCASKSGFQIEDLQGIMQPDGHFILIDPLSVTLPGGEYIGRPIPPPHFIFNHRHRRHIVRGGMKRVEKTLENLGVLHFSSLKSVRNYMDFNHSKSMELYLNPVNWDYSRDHITLPRSNRISMC